MFVSAGEAGDAKKVQTSVAAARKVFRIFRVGMKHTLLASVRLFSNSDPAALNDYFQYVLVALGSRFTCPVEPYSQS